jgi:hypothetical protein
MSDDTKIKQETYIEHEAMGEGIREWAKEIDLASLPEDAQDLLTGVFRDGFSMCLHKTLAPARDLSMMLLQMIALGKKAGPEAKLVLAGQPVEMMEELCHKIVGLPADWQLDDIVEAVHVDLENPPEDLPDEAVEEMKKIKEELKKDKKED